MVCYDIFWSGQLRYDSVIFSQFLIAGEMFLKAIEKYRQPSKLLLERCLPEQSWLRALSEKMYDGMICWTKGQRGESSFFILNNKLLVHRIL